MKSINIALCGVCFFIWSSVCFAQETTDKSSIGYRTLKEQVLQSDIAIEGEVIETTGFKMGNGPICTSAIVRITKVFKGAISDSVVEIVLYGGRYGDVISAVPDYLSLAKGYDGIFLLKINNTENRSGKNIQSYIPYFGKSSFIEYGGGSKEGLENGIFKDIESITGQKRKVIGLNRFERPSKFALETKVANSDVIIEGLVMSRQGFHVDTIIKKGKVTNYVSVMVKVSKIFKGKITDSVIEVIYLDGGLDEALADSYGFSVTDNEYGVFFLSANSTAISHNLNLQSFIPNYGRNSFARYKWADPFNQSYIAVCFKTTYHDVEKDLFQKIEFLTGQKRKIFALNQFESSSK